ncbi:cytochrome c [Parasalinivibrio latis]|uniref:c-type cytochrome n=1 Tax=Parasalinivibrio latis TaxID=2952610 RepID=UPI0030DE200D
MKRLPYFSVYLLALMAFSASAHQGATGVVKERMDAMEAMKEAVNELKATFRGKPPFDVGVIQRNATIIRDHAGESLINMFPEGSMQKPTAAKPEIWENWEKFTASAMKLETLSQALYDSAERQEPKDNKGKSKKSLLSSKNQKNESLESLPANKIFRLVGKECSSCHKPFRVKKKK